MERRKENLQLRENKISTEISDRDNSRINKRKYHGVNKIMKDYAREIYRTMYDPELFNELVKKQVSTQAISDHFLRYLEEINKRINKLIEEAREKFYDAYEKGQHRVTDKEGNKLKPETEDDQELQSDLQIDAMLKMQERYFKNLTADQNKLANKIIQKGADENKPISQVAAELSKEVKGLTKQRADLIAGSEIPKAHNVGQIKIMKDLEIEEYHYWSSNDGKVSEICLNHQGPKSNPHRYKVSQAGSGAPLPVASSHPRCRCQAIAADPKR